MSGLPRLNGRLGPSATGSSSGTLGHSGRQLQHMQRSSMAWERCKAFKRSPGVGAEAQSQPHHPVSAHWLAAALCGLLCLPQPLQAAPLQPQQLVLLDSNAAIVSQLKQLQQTKQKFGTQDPGSALAARFMGAQQQLQRIELLVKIQQYGNARMQLRQGSFKSLRSDLRYEAEYRGVQPELARGIVEGVELLDRQLRAEEPVDTITQGLQQLQAQLQQLVDQAQPPEQ